MLCLQSPGRGKQLVSGLTKKLLLVCLLLCAHSSAFAAGSFAMFQVAGPSTQAPTLRSNLNTGFLATFNEYQFIDFLQQGNATWTPGLGSFSTGTYTSALLDANGWPCTNQVNVSCPNSSGTNPIGPGTGKTFVAGVGVPA